MDITVKVKIGNVEVELTLEDAAELHAALGRICGKPETVTVPVPYAVPYAVPHHVHYEPRPWWQVWCSSSGNVTLSTSGVSCTSSAQGVR